MIKVADIRLKNIYLLFITNVFELITDQKKLSVESFTRFNYQKINDDACEVKTFLRILTFFNLFKGTMFKCLPYYDMNRNLDHGADQNPGHARIQKGAVGLDPSPWKTIKL